MIVGLVRNRKVLGLVEYVVCLYGKGELVLEQQFGDFSVEDEFIVLRGGVAAIPVVVEVGNQVDASRNGPVDRSVYLIVPCGGIVCVRYGVP